jgi:hypothetical protein
MMGLGFSGLIKGELRQDCSVSSDESDRVDTGSGERNKINAGVFVEARLVVGRSSDLCYHVINLGYVYSESGQRKSIYKVRVRASTIVGGIKDIVFKAEEI